ncbi:DUF1810 domain-containing protein [Sphingomonas endophytica]|uniref:Calpastatin n=1 Tax=Sphingomonas endophytica TaxID=869719 RepID=A0A147I867_9SPHN|nr:DUF1810 domain-containing protein [Sphingomonas endophytica]KTT75241.1 calpastatin [Sphingomonas endophytica]
MDFERFLTAHATHFDVALAELRAGRKRSHWMWFVFPQLAGLGRSDTARLFALKNLAEAGAYLAHPLLGPRYLACVDALLMHPDRSAEAIMGGIDALKLRSSLTLFDRAHAPPSVRTALDTFFDGPDRETLRLLGVEE